MFTEYPNLIYWDDGRVVVARPEERLEPILAKFFRTGRSAASSGSRNNFSFHKAPHLSTSTLRVYLRQDFERYPALSLSVEAGPKKVAPDAARRRTR